MYNLTNDIRMSSLEIAEVTGKNHKNVLRDIRNEIKELGQEISRLKFELTSYNDCWNRKQEMYVLNKSGIMQLILKYDALSRHAVISKLEQLENKQQKQLPQNYEQALEQLLIQVKENNKLAKSNREMLPKVKQYDTFLSVDSNQTMNEVAKSIGYGRNKLFKFLRNQKVLMKNNLPYQEYIDRGYFNVREVIIQHSDYEDIKRQTLVTTKGVEYISKKLHDKGIIN